MSGSLFKLRERLIHKAMSTKKAISAPAPTGANVWLVRLSNQGKDFLFLGTGALASTSPEAASEAVALAILWSRNKMETTQIAANLTQRFGYDLSQTPDDIRPTYKRTERASGSVPQAIVCALQASSFEDAIRNAVSIGGDSDTIAAIAGGIAEARFGIPEQLAKQTRGYLPADMRSVVTAFYDELQTSKKL